MQREVTFYRHLMFSYDVLLRDLFLTFFIDDSVLNTIFCSASVAIKNVWTLFKTM